MSLVLGLQLAGGVAVGDSEPMARTVLCGCGDSCGKDGLRPDPVQELTKLHTLAGAQSVNPRGLVCGPDGRPVDDALCDSQPCFWSLYPSRSGMALRLTAA